MSLSLSLFRSFRFQSAAPWAEKEMGSKMLLDMLDHKHTRYFSITWYGHTRVCVRAMMSLTKSN